MTPARLPLRIVSWLLPFIVLAPAPRVPAAVHLGNGIKIGEVDQTSAIIWVRLTAAAERRPDGPSFGPLDDHLPAGRSIGEMRDSLPGVPGSVRVRLLAPDGSSILTPWQPVDPTRDHTARIHLRDLRPATRYSLTVEGRAPGANAPEASLEGSFVTLAPQDADAPVRFAVISCHDFPRRDDTTRGHRIYRSIADIAPAFLIHTGDIVYYDKPAPYARDATLARYKWNRLFSLPYERDFYRNHAAWFIKDDHDTLRDDCWPGMRYGNLTWEEGLAIFREQVPVGPSPFRTFRHGRHLQIWLVEGREYRSANDTPDGPDKTIWGPAQKQWLFRSMRSSDATFRILVSPTPLVGPDRPNKSDNHANAGFRHEGAEVRAFLASLGNAFVICGDRHWQYASRDTDTGLREYACGPGTDAHAGGFSEDWRTPAHRFLRIGGGFLTVEVTTADNQPRIIFRHHDVAGTVVFEDRPQG